MLSFFIFFLLRTIALPIKLTNLQTYKLLDWFPSERNNRTRGSTHGIQGNHGHYSNGPFELHTYDAVMSTVKDLHITQYEQLERQVEETLTFFRKGSMLSMDIQVFFFFFFQKNKE